MSGSGCARTGRGGYCQSRVVELLRCIRGHFGATHTWFSPFLTNPQLKKEMPPTAPPAMMGTQPDIVRRSSKLLLVLLALAVVVGAIGLSDADAVAATSSTCTLWQG